MQSLKFYMGPQIGLLEFDDVDVAISWQEDPVLREWVKINVMGDDKIIDIYKGGETMETPTYIFTDFMGIKFAVVTGYDASYPEFYHFARSRDVKFVISYRRADGMASFMNLKYQSWSYAQETAIMIFSVMEVSGKVYYGIYAPVGKFKEKSGIIYEGSGRNLTEVSFYENS